MRERGRSRTAARLYATEGPERYAVGRVDADASDRTIWYSRARVKQSNLAPNQTWLRLG